MKRLQSRRKRYVERVLYTRQDTARMLGVSISTLVRMQDQHGTLTPVRLTGPRGRVWYRADEIMQLAEARS